MTGCLACAAALFLVIGAVTAAPLPVVNFCENGSFEVATTADTPDCWMAYLQPKLTSGWYDCWVLDRDVAFEGKASMRLSAPPKGGPVGIRYAGAINSWKRVHPCGMPIRSKNGNYTLSLAMKSRKGTVHVEGRLIFSTKKYGRPVKVVKMKWQVGPEWKRYSHTVSGIQARIADISIGGPSKGTVWIDAIQLEEGEVARDYTPCAFDRPPKKTGGPSEPKLSMACGTTKSAPTVDGRLDDVCWKNAYWVGDFQIHLKGGAAKQQTQAAMVSDGRSLFIAFRCHTPDAKAVRTKSRSRRDGLLWGSEDIAEVFLDTNGDGVSYLHFAANAAGVKYDATCNFYNDTPNPVCDQDWNGQWRIATNRQAQAWTAEIAIPIATLARWGIGKVSGIALCRENSNGENSYWGGPFHRPAQFARLTGLKGRTSEYTYGLDDIGIQFRSLAEGAFCVTARVNNETGRARAVMPSATVLLPSGKQLLAEAPLTKLKHGEERLFRLGAFSLPPDVRDCAVTLHLLNENDRLVAVNHDRSIPVSLPIAIKPRYTLYTNEKTAGIVLDLALPDKELRGEATVELAVLGQSASWARKRITNLESAHSVWPMDITRLPVGDHRIEARLMRRGGKTVVVAHCELRKRAPARDVVKIDTVRRSLVVNGKDFLPYICTYLRVPEPLWRVREVMQELRQENFNTVWAQFNKRSIAVSDEKIRLFLDLAHKNDLRVSFWIWPFVKDEKTGKWRKEDSPRGFTQRIRHVVTKFRDHPAILAWCLIDEPTKFRLDEQDAYWLRKICKLTTDLDPYHPVYGEWRPRELQMQFKRDGGRLPFQIASTHRYVIPTGTPLSMLQRVDFMVQKRSEGWKPTWIFVQDWAGMGRVPSPDETSCMVYLSLARGMTGIGYWHGVWPCSLLVKKRMGVIGAELRQLAPYMMTRDRTDAIVARPDAVYALVRGEVGKSILITVNVSATVQNATLDLAGVRGGPFAKAEVLFENRSVRIRGGKLHDRYGPLGRHVYLLQK